MVDNSDKSRLFRAYFPSVTVGVVEGQNVATAYTRLQMISPSSTMILVWWLLACVFMILLP